MSKEPFRITVEHYDKKHIIEIDHSDITFDKYYDMLKDVSLSLGFSEKTVLEYFEND